MAEQNYNRAHKRTRNIIERTFGIWKAKFPCLRKALNTKVETSVAIICAVAVLHNIAIQYRDNYEPEDVNIDDENINYIIDNENADGLHYRRAFIITYFGNN